MTILMKEFSLRLQQRQRPIRTTLLLCKIEQLPLNSTYPLQTPHSITQLQTQQTTDANLATTDLKFNVANTILNTAVSDIATNVIDISTAKLNVALLQANTARKSLPANVIALESSSTAAVTDLQANVAILQSNTVTSEANVVDLWANTNILQANVVSLDALTADPCQFNSSSSECDRPLCKHQRPYRECCYTASEYNNSSSKRCFLRDSHRR